MSDLDVRFAITAEQRAQFEEDGFIVLRGALAPQVIRDYEPEITAKVFELNTQHLPVDQRPTAAQRAALQVMNLWEHGDRVRNFVFSPRLAQLAAELLGVRAVRIYHDQTIYKEPGGDISPWHADQYYWPLSSDRACSIWIPLQDTPLEMGPLIFAAGSHTITAGRDLPVSDESEARMQAVLRERAVPIYEQPFQLGDLSVHLGWTFHRAGRNTTQEPRKAMVIIYMDADITVTAPTPGQQGDAELWLSDVPVGAVPETAKTPVLAGAS
jgi:ectoine hydroxylase-related dioxygenase (phytanoyl-CoA dioxygenase family)